MEMILTLCLDMMPATRTSKALWRSWYIQSSSSNRKYHFFYESLGNLNSHKAAWFSFKPLWNTCLCLCHAHCMAYSLKEFRAIQKHMKIILRVLVMWNERFLVLQQYIKGDCYFSHVLSHWFSGGLLCVTTGLDSDSLKLYRLCVLKK